MKTINKKLNSQSGVTILFAMLLFLVATVVSLVIIVAATSSVNRESSFKESVQRNIELDSAVLIVKNFTDNKHEYTFVGEEGNYDYQFVGTENELEKVIIEISKRVINNTQTKNVASFTISGDNLSNIDCNYEIDFNTGSSPFVILTFSIKDGDNAVVSKIFSKYSFSVYGKTVSWNYDRSTVRGAY